MILNTGSRTDIPAYYSQWFYRRVEEGYLLARNPYNPVQVTRYELKPEVVDCLTFCTKNPAPMLSGLPRLRPFRQVWYVTVTPYGKEIEPFVPDKEAVLASFKELSRAVGERADFWRYDPIFLNDTYTVEYHLRQFEAMASALAGYTSRCVISFIDLYEKTKRNFPGIRAVRREERLVLGENLARIAGAHGIKLHTCCEGDELAPFGIDCGGCMTREVLEQAIGERLLVPGGRKPARQECSCLLGNDIGAYNSCGHGCLYCYANYDRATVIRNMKAHDPASPYLIGHSRPDEVIRAARQESWIDRQISLDDWALR